MFAADSTRRDTLELTSASSKEFRVASTSLGTGGTSKSAVEANHYRGALRFALTKHFKTNRAIVLLDDRAEFSPDLFWYFAQLEPTLMSEDSLWCVSAWNDNGLAPYVADLSALFRTDWHPSFAWMMRSATAWWLHDRWPKDHVSQFLTADAVRQGRQCVIPEISRARRLRVASSRSEQVWLMVLLDVSLWLVAHCCSCVLSLDVISHHRLCDGVPHANCNMCCGTGT